MTHGPEGGCLFFVQALDGRVACHARNTFKLAHDAVADTCISSPLAVDTQCVV
jgi:hypothetical protein